MVDFLHITDSSILMECYPPNPPPSPSKSIGYGLDNVYTTQIFSHLGATHKCTNKTVCGNDC